MRTKIIAALPCALAAAVLLSFLLPGVPAADDKGGQIEGFLDRGNELALKGDLDGALSEYKKVLALDAENALAHNNLGIIYKRKGLYISAVEEFQAALKALPNYYKAYNNLANVYTERGYYDEAIKYYNKCLGIKPNFADAHWNIALAYEKTDDKTRAISHFRKFIELSDASSYVAVAQQHIDAMSAPPQPEPAEEPGGPESPLTPPAEQPTPPGPGN